MDMAGRDEGELVQRGEYLYARALETDVDSSRLRARQNGATLT